MHTKLEFSLGVQGAPEETFLPLLANICHVYLVLPCRLTFWERVLLCSLHWPRTHFSHLSSSEIPGKWVDCLPF